MSPSNSERVLVINPGATSTKFAVFEGECPFFRKTVEHSAEELQGFRQVFDQYRYRLKIITEALAEAGISPRSLKAVVGRGGLLKPLAGGTYAVTMQMLEDLKRADRGEHASNLGAVIAFTIAATAGIPAFIVDPVSVDEMQEVARVSGLPDIQRISMSHALNMKAVARKVAGQMGAKYEEVNFIVVHLGTGVSVAAHRKGRAIDLNNNMDEGPFSPDRCGGVPAAQLVKLCFSGQYTYQEMRERISGKGGMYAYLGTKDIREAEAMAGQGNEQARLVLDALAYQTAKEIGALAAVLEGEVDRIILTGGMAHSRRIVGSITRRVQFIAPVVAVPGEEELEALALGALRVLRGAESAKLYGGMDKNDV